MKRLDTIKLAGMEFRYGKREWLISSIMHIFSIACVLVCMNCFLGINRIGNDILVSTKARDGFYFTLENFTEADASYLERIGFHDVVFSDNGTGTHGIIDSVEHIWTYKIRAILSGKDIWNEELDPFLVTLFLARITFLAIGILLWILCMGNLSNSFRMKLEERSAYCSMLHRLGVKKKNLFAVFYCFFFQKCLVIWCGSVVVQQLFLLNINRFLRAQLMISEGPFYLMPGMILVVIGISIFYMWLSLWRNWKDHYEDI